MLERPSKLLGQEAWRPSLEGGRPPPVMVDEQAHDIELGRSSRETQQGLKARVVDPEYDGFALTSSALQSLSPRVELAQFHEQAAGEAIWCHAWTLRLIGWR